LRTRRLTHSPLISRHYGTIPWGKRAKPSWKEGRVWVGYGTGGSSGRVESGRGFGWRGSSGSGVGDSSDGGWLGEGFLACWFGWSGGFSAWG